MTSAADARPPIPVTVIGGYLGAGKTTLVNHLLRAAAGRRLAVLVNEFGTLPIDADLIEARDEQMIAITGGCICCSYGSDLVAALIDMARRDPRPDQLLVETSGVALPGAVASTLNLVAGLALDAVVVLADAETVRARAEDRYTGDTITRQLADADLVLLNKADLLAPIDVAEVADWVQQAAARARVVPTSHSRVPPELVLTASALDDAVGRIAIGGTEAKRSAHHRHIERGGGSVERHAHGHDAGGHDSASFEIDHPVDPDRLACALVGDDIGLVRAKGFVRDAEDRLVEVQIVGRRRSLATAIAGRGGGGRLVAISVGRAVDRVAVEAAIAAARVT